MRARAVPAASVYRGPTSRRSGAFRPTAPAGWSSMSQAVQSRRIRAIDLAKRKAAGAKIIALTAYHAHTAGILDPHCDFILVGDSLGMLMHGMESTLPVTLEMMIVQAQAVMRGTSRALIVVDMPFGSYEASPQQAFLNAARVLKETGAGAIKMEGGARFAETVAFLVERGVPVMGHIGLTPQSVNTMGGFKVQGREADGERRLMADARAINDAGAFAIVMEGIVEPVARAIATCPDITAPTIGIGATMACDGQILVLEDMLGLSDRVPKFVKRFGTLRGQIEAAVKDYAEEVRSGAFPADEHTYQPL